ncbi:hypothetical protein [Sphingomonas sp. Ant20]|uniref:hypothetical protein n=1 Tax=Sphingomonas sp. Ant20 TaxID=104605 RepID=UPI0018E3D1CD|nr:hypothetical protein [Sphingomonas sp. Ant20]
MLLLTGCAHATMPVPYIEDSLRSLREDTVAFYDSVIAHAGDAGCEYSNNVAFWTKSKSALFVLGYRVRARPEDAIMVAPLDELKETFRLYEVAYQTAEAHPAPTPEIGQNAKCLPPQLAAMNSTVIEDGIDNLVRLQSLRKELAK